MVVYRVHRDDTLFDYLLTYYAQFYAAIQAQALEPPPLKQKEAIIERINQSMQSNIDYKFWEGARPYTQPPDLEEGRSSKRQRTSSDTDM